MRSYRDDPRVQAAQTVKNEAEGRLQQADELLEEATRELQTRREALEEARALESLGDAVDVDAVRGQFEAQREALEEATIEQASGARATAIAGERLKSAREAAKRDIHVEILSEADRVAGQLAITIRKLIDLNGQMSALDRARADNQIPEGDSPLQNWAFYVSKPLGAQLGYDRVSKRLLEFADFYNQTEEVS